MKEKIRIDTGEIEFTDEYINIFDNARKQYINLIVFYFFWMIVGVLTLYRGIYTSSFILTGIGGFVTIGMIFIIALNLFIVHTSNCIFIKDIKKIRFGESRKNSYMDIRTKDNKLRKINGLGASYNKIYKLVTDYYKNKFVVE